MENSEVKHTAENDDLKFIPMDTSSNLLCSNAMGQTIQNLTDTGLNGITNNFLYDFATPINNVKEDENFYADIDYIPEVDTEYPIEIYADESYLSCQIPQNEPRHMKVLREFDLFIEDFKDIRGKKSDVEKIFKKIEETDEAVIKILKLYNIPYPIAALLVKKIISLTLKYKD
ncbi:hypothetical protein [Caproiciproducens sp. MSJ-32]|uniref:hypothetical protein n=1 Tax=Caproiciproducens sp. MSJ-32 TaxID=2841527 RepID=UPI001C105F77|nr:hypothetical protein [Caproiciproducens sp. MSJ-32]MBU5453933.1 hypothetical protein [Caproiciproducens sp. MSJ-32]